MDSCSGSIEDWGNSRTRLNTVGRQVGVRRTVGEEAAAAFEDAFGGVE